MRTEVEAITQDTLFHDPMHVSIEASTAIVMEHDLDTFNGDQFSILDDVISVRFDRFRGEVTFVTCRTLARPGRGEVTIPLGAIQEILAIGPSDTGTRYGSGYRKDTP